VWEEVRGLPSTPGKLLLNRENPWPGVFPLLVIIRGSGKGIWGSTPLFKKLAGLMLLFLSMLCRGVLQKGLSEVCLGAVPYTGPQLLDGLPETSCSDMPLLLQDV